MYLHFKKINQMQFCCISLILVWVGPEGLWQNVDIRRAVSYFVPLVVKFDALRPHYFLSALVTTAVPKTHSWGSRISFSLLKLNEICCSQFVETSWETTPPHKHTAVQLLYVNFLGYVFFLIWFTYFISTNPLFFRKSLAFPVLPLYQTIWSWSACLCEYNK